MNCGAFEPLIALHVEGDLSEQDTRRVEEHLAICSGCRNLLDDLRASQAVVKDVASEAVDVAMLAAVRSGVLARIGEHRRWLGWCCSAALAAALALIVALVLAPPKPTPEPRPVPIAQAPPKPDEPKIEALAEPSPRPARRRTPRPPRSIAAKTDEPLVVKMLTDDPNIVIIWLVDQTGD